MSDPRAFIEEAQKLEKPQLGFMSFLSGSLLSSRLEEATDLYIQAANHYRLAKDFAQAGKQFVKAANLQEKLGNHNDTANHLIEAYKCFKGPLPPEAIDALSKAIHIFLTQNGQFRRAANFTMDLGELYESIADTENASKSYEQAGDYFTTDHAEALLNKAYLKCADLYAGAEKDRKAVDMYEIVIKNLLGNNLTKWNVKDYFLKTILCVLCENDVVEAEKKSAEFNAQEPTWETTREYKLVNDILAAIKEGDVQDFQDKLFEFDQFQKLDKLTTSLLLKIKLSVVEQDDDDDLLWGVV